MMKYKRTTRPKSWQTITLLMGQMAEMNTSKGEKPKATSCKVPNFDIELDIKSFPQWIEKWNAYCIGNKLHTIEDVAERNERILCDLKGALTINTLKWLAHRDRAKSESSKNH